MKKLKYQLIICFWIIIFSPFILLAQGWEKTYGGDLTESVQKVFQNDDGSFTALGNETVDNENELTMLKVDSEGNEISSTLIGGAYSDIEKSINGGYILLGSNADADRISLVKIDEDGTEEWEQTYSSTFEERGNAVISTSDLIYAHIFYEKKIGYL